MSTASPLRPVATVTSAAHSHLPDRLSEYLAKCDAPEFAKASAKVTASYKGKEYTLTPQQWISAARQAVIVRDYRFAGLAYHTAYNADLTLRITDAFDDLNAICEKTIGEDLESLLDEPKGAADIAKALKRTWNVDSGPHDDSEEEEPAAKRPRTMTQEEKAPPVKEPPAKKHWRDVAAYVFNRMANERVAYQIKVQKALYWACAEWARRYGCTLFLDTSFRHWDFGPASREVFHAVRDEWRKVEHQNDSAILDDTELTAVLDAAIDHVRGRTWDDISEESHMERLYMCTPKNYVFTEEDIVKAYADDPTGKLASIFGHINAAGADDLGPDDAGLRRKNAATGAGKR